MSICSTKGFFTGSPLRVAIRAVDKREYLVIISDDFCKFCIKNVVTPHLNRLDETVQTRGHNIWF